MDRSRPPGGVIRYLVVIDGEHYPPVTKAAIDELRATGADPVVAVLAGGKEKLVRGGLDHLGIPVEAADDPRAALERALVEHRPDRVLDLSDEPVLDYTRRHLFASISLFHGVPYEGADFLYTPPTMSLRPSRPTISFIGTGKRTGKTAVTGLAARLLKSTGTPPVVIAMGRGGPEEPEVLRGDAITLTPRDLLDLADQGKHAASDYVEDALLAGVPVVGCRRCGGGLPGGMGFTNLAAGLNVAEGLPGDVMLLEGSGSAIPPARADAFVLVAPADVPLGYLTGYFGPFRLLLADLLVVTMCEEPFGSPSRISEIVSSATESFRGDARDQLRVVRTVFRPSPVEDVGGAAVFVATTAPQTAADAIRTHLRQEHGCEVIGMTHALSDRDRLEHEMGESWGGADVILCEIKAAGIDVVTRKALAEGRRVVFMDNVPRPVADDDLEGALLDVARQAQDRFGDV